MAPVLHDEPRSHSFELKLYNATTEPIEFQLAATSSFRLKAGSPTTESLSVSSHVVVTTSSFSNVVEFTVDGIPYQINSPSSGGKGWIALDRESTRSKLLLPIEGRGLSTNEKSVVKDPEFFVYQVNEMKSKSPNVNLGDIIDVVELIVVPATPLKSWTSLIPDTTNLSEVYIPGTHESMALFGYPHSTCQYDPTETSLSSRFAPTPVPKIGNITNQLNNGVRFLDLRFSLFPVKTKSTSNSRFFSTPSNTLGAKRQEVEGDAAKEWELLGYHGIINQKILAKDVFDEIYRFLDSAEGRNETIIVSIKQENSADSSAFAQTVHNLINLPRNRSTWYTEARWPRMEEVRGKIVLFCRFEHWENGGGLHTPRWDDASKTAWETVVGGQRVVVQDWYKISSFKNITQKANLVLSLFDASDFANASSVDSLTTYRIITQSIDTAKDSKARRSSKSSSTDSFDSTWTRSSPDQTSVEMKVTRAPIPVQRPIRINFTSGASFPFFPPILVARGVGSNLSLSVRSPFSATGRGGNGVETGRESSRLRLRLTRRVQGVNEIILAELLRRIKARLERPESSEVELSGEGGMMILTDYVKPSDGFTQLIISLNRIVI